MKTWRIAWVLFATCGLLARPTERPVVLREPAVRKVTLPDPAFPENPPTARRVVARFSPDGFPVGYSLKIVAAVCLDQKCKLVEATLYWDALGRYERIEHPPGKPLTKKEHEPFTEADYRRLDEILKDRESILGNHTLAGLAKTPAKDAQAGEGHADGESGATPDTVKNAVVPDAAWSTWVLWRYVNGEIVPQLRAITVENASPRYVRRLLKGDDVAATIFALGVIESGRFGGEGFADEVSELLKSDDPTVVERALGVLRRSVAAKDELHRRLIAAIPAMHAEQIPLVVEFFASETALPPTTLERLSGALKGLSYRPVHVVLRLLEQRGFFSARTEQDVTRLLEHEDFYVARRAYEFLRKQTRVSAETGARLEAFAKANEDRL